MTGPARAATAPLILLFGMPRSGTTWIGKLFDSHPDTLYRHEPDDRGLLNFMPLFSDARSDVDCKAGLDAFVDGLWSRREEKVVDSLPIFPKAYLSTPRLLARRATVSVRKLAPWIMGGGPSPSFTRALVALGTPVVWKSIESLGRLGSIARLRPESRSVMILRHPCGYVASTLRGEQKGKFEGGKGSSEDWPIFEKACATPAARAAGIDMAVVKAMSEVERLALKWALYSEHARTDTEANASVLPVRYEDVCFDTAATVQRLFAHCGLNFGEQTARFINYSIGGERSGYYSIVKNPQRSATKWESELSPAQIDEVLSVIRRFGVGRQHYG